MLFEPVPCASPDKKPVDDGGRAGIRSKLGGTPDWIQETSKGTAVECDTCGEEMTFVAQIDSMEFQGPGLDNPHGRPANDRDYIFGDVGMIYVFWCFHCCLPKCLWECE